MKRSETYLHRPGVNEGCIINNLLLQTSEGQKDGNTWSLFKQPKQKGIVVREIHTEEREECQRVSKKNDGRWAEFINYIRETGFNKDQLRIKVFEKIDHPENVMAFLRDKDMKKKITKSLNHERNGR